MCVVSAIGDYYDNKWKQPDYTTIITNLQSNLPVTRFEFDQLKKEVEEMKALLKVAVDYDKKNNEPACQMEEKIATLKKVAELLGVDLTGVI